jgi:hypothetical protein
MDRGPDDTSRASSSSRRRAVWAGAIAAAVAGLVTAVVLVLGDSAEGERDELDAAAPSASPSSSKAARKPVAEPTQVVPRQKPKEPVRAGLEDEVGVTDGVSVQITEVEAVRGVGRGPGEASGPALRVSVEVDNGSDEPVNLDLAQVNLFFGPDDAPAGELSGPGVRRFSSDLSSGEDTVGVFVFSVPTDARERVRVDFTYSTEAPRVIFTGAVSG